MANEKAAVKAAPAVDSIVSEDAAPVAPAAPAVNPEIEAMKAQIAMLQAMVAQTALVAQSAAASAPDASEAASFDAQIAGGLSRTKALLDAQPKRTVRLRQNPKGQVQLPDAFVGVNGWNYQLQRGKDIPVPQTVYDLLVDANEI